MYEQARLLWTVGYVCICGHVTGPIVNNSDHVTTVFITLSIRLFRLVNRSHTTVVITLYSANFNQNGHDKWRAYEEMTFGDFCRITKIGLSK